MKKSWLEIRSHFVLSFRSHFVLSFNRRNQTRTRQQEQVRAYIYISLGSIAVMICIQSRTLCNRRISFPTKILRGTPQRTQMVELRGMQHLPSSLGYPHTLHLHSDKNVTQRSITQYEQPSVVECTGSVGIHSTRAHQVVALSTVKCLKVCGNSSQSLPWSAGLIKVLEIECPNQRRRHYHPRSLQVTLAG